MDEHRVIDPNVRDISAEVLDDDGRLRILSAEYWKSTSVDERVAFAARNGVYGFPTLELVDYLRERIGDKKAIEIGAGNGVLAQALGITATDSLQQAKPHWKLYYTLQGQQTVSYGPNVIEAHASQAVRRFKPDIVIGCWVTHKWAGDAREGNAEGIDEGDIINNCGTYIMIGNEHVHRNKPIWDRPHTIEYPPFLVSRAFNGTRDFIATWLGPRRLLKRRT